VLLFVYLQWGGVWHGVVAGHGPEWGKATVRRTKGMIARHRTALLGVLTLGAGLVTPPFRQLGGVGALLRYRHEAPPAAVH
jgi:hypothetical protein